jgi:hypothetical protein
MCSQAFFILVTTSFSAVHSSPINIEGLTSASKAHPSDTIDVIAEDSTTSLSDPILNQSSVATLLSKSFSSGSSIELIVQSGDIVDFPTDPAPIDERLDDIETGQNFSETEDNADISVSNSESDNEEFENVELGVSDAEFDIIEAGGSIDSDFEPFCLVCHDKANETDKCDLLLSPLHCECYIHQK